MATQRRNALGRGLDALLSMDDVKTEGSSSINEIELAKISVNPNQPRREFDETALQELADSIAEIGIIQPITLRKVSDNEYQIIAGERLTEQELRNATYTGSWLTNAKSIFSKSNCAAYLLSKDYVNGSPIRQELLEKALLWISKGDIEGYMSIHQHDPNANELWTYYRNVIEWVRLTFTTYRKEMKGIDWGKLYDTFNSEMYDTDKLEQEIQKLMMDDDVTNKKGIYTYILTRDERFLNIRAFTESQKRAAYERQGGLCLKCGKHFPIKEMQGDHITPWSKGGKTNVDNCQMLCADCNRRKSDI